MSDDFDFRSFVDNLNAKNTEEEPDMSNLRSKTIKLDYDDFLDALEPVLVRFGIIQANEFLYDADLGLPVNDNGEIEFDIEYFDEGGEEVRH